MANGPATSADGRIQRPAPNGGTSLAGQGGGGPKSLAALINSPEFITSLKAALPKHMTPAKMARIILTALRTTRDLAKCTPESFLGCVMQAAQLGLEPNTPTQQCYLIPRRNNKAQTTECTLIVGYQGMIELALRSGKVQKIWTRTVREGDEFQVKYGLTEDIVHIPSNDPQRERMPITYVYAVAQLSTGGCVFEVLSDAQIRVRRDQSAAGNSGPWAQHTEAMTRKTAVRSLFKWLPKNSEMAMVESLDQRADEGRSQMFDSVVTDGMTAMGVQPIYDTDGEETPHDAQTGEVTPDAGPTPS